MAAVKSDRPALHDLEWRGSTYFKIEDRSDPDKIKPYYVVYEDTKLSINGIEIKQAKTLLVFRGCDWCNSDYIFAAGNILSKKGRGSLTLEQIVDFFENSPYKVKNINKKDVSCSKCSDRSHSHCTQTVYDKCVARMKQEVATWDFIASVTTDCDVCRADKCSGQGQCKQIPFTKTHQCICEKNYEGESCEKRVDFDDSIEKLLSYLRRTFRVINGVPTTVDMYFSVRSLSQNLDIVMKKVQDSKGYTNKIVQHSQVIYDIEDRVDLYAKLQNNIVTFDQFGQDVD